MKRCYRCGAPPVEAGLCDKCRRGRQDWERYLLPEGEHVPTATGQPKVGEGVRWLLRVLGWATVLVAGCLLGAMIAQDYDREYILRSRLIRSEAR